MSLESGTRTVGGGMSCGRLSLVEHLQVMQLEPVGSKKTSLETTAKILSSDRKRRQFKINLKVRFAILQLFVDLGGSSFL